jgi:hypothetical protein
MGKFTVDETTNLVNDLQQERRNSKKTSKLNQGYDIAFKVSIFLASLGVTLCSAFAASELFSNTKIISLRAAILGTFSTAFSGLSTSIFNFATRQQVWQLKATGYGNLSDRVKFMEVDDEATLRIKGELDHIDDSYTIDAVQNILKKIDDLQGT